MLITYCNSQRLLSLSTFAAYKMQQYIGMLSYLLSFYDADPCLSDPTNKARVAALYISLLNI